MCSACHTNELSSILGTQVRAEKTDSIGVSSDLPSCTIIHMLHIPHTIIIITIFKKKNYEFKSVLKSLSLSQTRPRMCRVLDYESLNPYTIDCRIKDRTCGSLNINFSL